MHPSKTDLPEGRYSAQDLAKEGLLIPGKNIKINDRIYLAVGNANVTKLIDLQSNIKYPVDVLLQGKIKVAALQPHETQQVKQIYDSYKSGKEILKMIDKGKVDNVSFKKSSIISLSKEKDSGLSTQALIETADNIVKKERLSNGQNPITLHEAKQIHAVINYSEVAELQTVLDNKKEELSHKELQDIKKKLKSNGQDNIANTLEAFEELNKQKPKNQQKNIKALVTETISKKSSGESVVNLSSDINANKYSSITFTNDVNKSVKKIIETHKTSESINPNKSLINNTNYNKYQVFTNEPSDKALQFTSEYETRKDIQVKVDEIEFQKFTKNAVTDNGKNHEILTQLSSRASSFDKRLNTNIIDKIKNNPYLHSEVKSTDGIGLKDINTKSNIDLIRSTSQKFQQLENTKSDIKIGYNGTVLHSDSTGSNYIAQHLLKNKALHELSGTHLSASEIFKTLETTSPEHLNKITSKLQKQKNTTIQKYPRNIQNQTGLLSIATGIVGTYFYQQMITGAAIKANKIISNFIQPNEIIEANRHSSIETSTRRILSTDFGGGWSSLAMVVKDMALHGRTGAIQFISAEKTTSIEKLRKTFDPLVTKGRKIAEEIGDNLTAGSKRLSKFINKGGVSDLVKSGLDYVDKNKTSIGSIAGGVVLFSRLGSNDWRTGTKEYEVLKTKYRGAHFKDYLENNSVRPDDWRDSVTNIDSKVMTGFGSPWYLKNALHSIISSSSKGTRVFSLAHKSAKELAEGFVTDGAGFQMKRTTEGEFQLGTITAFKALIKEIDGGVIGSFYSKRAADTLSTMAVLNPGQTARLNKHIGSVVSLAGQNAHNKTKEFTELFAKTQRLLAVALVKTQKAKISTVLTRRVKNFKDSDRIRPLALPSGPIDGRILNTSKYNNPRFTMRQRANLDITNLDDGRILLTRKRDVETRTLKRLVENGGVRIKNKNNSRLVEVSFVGRNKPNQIVAVTNSGKKVPIVEYGLGPITPKIAPTNIPTHGTSTAPIRINTDHEAINNILMDRNKVTGNNYSNTTTVLNRLSSL